MLGNVKKSLFRVLCLGALCLGGLMAEQDPKELVGLGAKSYKEKDFTQAKKYFEKACDLKENSGCFNLGVLYYQGQGVEKNLKKAASFYTKACDLNYSNGCHLLGNLYYSGQGVSQNTNKALQYYSKACDLKYAEGCASLGGSITMVKW